MADPPINTAIREGNAIEALQETQHEAGQDLSIAQLGTAMGEVMKWADRITEVINRELLPAAADARNMINGRHGSFQRIDDSFVTPLTDEELTISENIEFVACFFCDDVYLPRIEGHPGMIHIWTTGSVQLTINAHTGTAAERANSLYRSDQINELNTVVLGSNTTGATLFNDGGINEAFPQWYVVGGS